MKVLCTQCLALIAFLVLVPQPAAAFEDSRSGQQEPDKKANQRGPQNRELKPWEARPWDPKPPAPKPWESRPWDSASEEVRPKDLRPDEAQKADERRRVGRKARKERSEKKENTAEAGSYQDRVKQRQNKWQRHQMESERYYPAGM